MCIDDNFRSCGSMRSRSYGLQFLLSTSPAWVSLLLVVLLVVLLAGCKSTNAENYSVFPGEPHPGHANYSTNLMQEGDLVSISFEFSTNYNTLQKIGLDGKLNLPSVGMVKAAGKTPPQLQTDLGKLYEALAKDDPITVKVAATASSVYISGAVFHPGKIPLDRPMTVLEAVMEA